MTTKIPAKITDTVSQTLFIPVAAKAADARCKKPILNDKTSLELEKCLDSDVTQFQNSFFNTIGVCVRSKYFDEELEKFIEIHNNPVAIIIGCGLDARACRIKRAKPCKFYSIDLDEVIALRELCIPPQKDEVYISDSILKDTWIKTIQKQEPKANFIIIIEGVLMYFNEAGVKSIFKRLLHNFPGSDIYFDGIASWVQKNSDKHPTLKNTNARFLWGCDNYTTLESWDPKIKFVSEQYNMNLMKQYSFRACLASFIPPILRSSSFLHFQVLQKEEARDKYTKSQ